MISYIIIGVIAIIAIYIIIIYNRMVKNRNRLHEAWSIIDVYLKKRYDLIPNLVNAVKGYSAYENNILEELTRIRTEAMQSATVSDKSDNETKLDKVLNQLYAIAEKYPDLKASDSFLKLQEQISQIENDLEKARRYYNGCVRENNIYVESFPAKMIAKIFNFGKESFFQAGTNERQIPSTNL